MNKPEKIPYGEKICKLRHERGWPQEELGKRCGMRHSQIGVYERSETARPKRETLKRIADGFGITYEELIKWDGSGMKILHTGDWHIGPQKGPEKDGKNLRAEDTLNCLRYMVRVAQQERPDLVLVSGDIFHVAEIGQARGHRELLQARDIILELSKIAGDVVVMRGTPNHDCRESFEALKAQFDLISNVHVVPEPKILHLAAADIAVLPGFDKGYFRAHNPGIGKEDENAEFTRALKTLVVGMRAQSRDDRINILMAHYTVPGCDDRAGQIQFFAKFEPVISRESLITADYDLVALGHIHKPQQLAGIRNAFYCGAVNALNFNDEYQVRGFYIHEFDGRCRTESRFIRTPARKFLTIRLNDEEISGINSEGAEWLRGSEYYNQVPGKIVRILYSCTGDLQRVFNPAPVEKALYEAGAFYVAGIEAESIETANRTELSRFDDPENNLQRYLEEKAISADKAAELIGKARPVIAKARAGSAVSEFSGAFMPMEISVRNYRNYAEETFSFEDISFCTVNGANGTGKSSLFMDAIIDCLYEEPREGALSGPDKRPSWLRNDSDAKSGSISFTFRIGDKVFRVVRTRTRSGKITLNLSELIDGDWTDRSKEKAADTQTEIIRVLGMDSTTFKACVLIMQDQYGIFLEAGKEERVGVLSNLLGLGIYRDMEELTAEKLRDLRREAAGCSRDADIYARTIEGYGNPEADKSAVDSEIERFGKIIDGLRTELDNKKLLLMIQEEAEAKYKKALSAVETLRAKSETLTHNAAEIASGIEACDSKLRNEPEVTEKADRYNRLSEEDKEYAKAADVYTARWEEKLRLDRQASTEKANIERIEEAIKAKEAEIAELSSDDAGEIREKASEYEQARKALEDANIRLTAYLETEKGIAAIRADYRTAKARAEAAEQLAAREIEARRTQAELLNNVECVDTGRARCAFLAKAIEARDYLESNPDWLDKVRENSLKSLEPLRLNLEEAEKALEGLKNPTDEVEKLKAAVTGLKAYPAMLDEINQREGRIAVLKATIGHMKESAQAARLRLSSTVSGAEAASQAMEGLKTQLDRHNEIEAEMKKLEPYSHQAAEYPVIKERRQNLTEFYESTQSRLSEVDKELTAAEKELKGIAGATADIGLIRTGIEDLDSRIRTLERERSDKQGEAGALAHKISELKSLRDKVSELNGKIAALNGDCADYEALKAAFSQDGIPHQIIRSLVPRLTEVSSSILGQMTGGQMGVAFQTEKVLKSNNKKEVVTLDVSITEAGKPPLPYMSKSGGEKVKASLSVILALAEVKSSLAGMQLGLLGLDEPPFLDADGTQAYVDALETIQARYPGLKVMAITHDQGFKARFPQSVTVYRDDHGSHVRWD